MHKVLFLSGTILLVAVVLGCEEICAQIDPSLAGLCVGPGPDGDADTDIDPDECELQLDKCLDVCGPGIWTPMPLDDSTVPVTDEDTVVGDDPGIWPMTCEDVCWEKYYQCSETPPPPPGECESDAQCPDGFFCELVCYDTCQAIGCPEPGCFGQCVPFEPPPPPPAECKYDWDCGPEQVCEFVCWDCAYPEDGDLGFDCEPGCTGYCVDVPPPPGPDCTSDADCPDGFLCEIVCWENYCDETLPDCPEGGCFGECVPGTDPLPWPA